jgi:ribosomal peptide maturation radical SAM protein 1
MSQVKISLIAMPQTLTAAPSLALTQLAAVAKDEFGGRAAIDIIYANLDFVALVGYADYKEIENNGFTEWLFQREAFPDSPDNSLLVKELFLAEGNSLHKGRFFDRISKIRSSIPEFLAGLISKYDLLQYDVVGFTSVFSQNIASFALARKIKAKMPAVKIIMGGPNCDYPMGKVIIDRVGPIDFVFSGSAIISFVRFIDCILKGDLQGVHRINGVLSKENRVVDLSGSPDTEMTGEKQYQVKPKGDCHNLKMTSGLNYDDFLKKYEQFRKISGFTENPILFFETSKGCWKRDRLPCAFCGLNDPELSYTSMEPDSAVESINRLIAQYSDKCMLFYCVDNIIDKKYLHEVLPRLKAPSGTMLSYETRSTLTKEELNLCAHSGVRIIQPGIESLNTAELRLMQKGVSAFSNIIFLKNCIETGIYPIWNLLYGLPRQQDDSGFKKLLINLPLLRHLPPPSSYVPISLVRFSPYFEKAGQYGLDLEPDLSYSILYPLAERDLFNLAYLFKNKDDAAGYMALASRYTPEIACEVVFWISLFRSPAAFPKLLFLNAQTIFDSRFDLKHPLTYEISPLEQAILEFLEKPRKLRRIEERFVGESGFAEKFYKIKDQELLFMEDDIVISLVCKEFAWDKPDYLKCIKAIALTTANDF